MEDHLDSQRVINIIQEILEKEPTLGENSIKYLPPSHQIKFCIT